MKFTDAVALWRETRLRVFGETHTSEMKDATAEARDVLTRVLHKPVWSQADLDKLVIATMVLSVRSQQEEKEKELQK